MNSAVSGYGCPVCCLSLDGCVSLSCLLSAPVSTYFFGARTECLGEGAKPKCSLNFSWWVEKETRVQSIPPGLYCPEQTSASLKYLPVPLSNQVGLLLEAATHGCHNLVPKVSGGRRGVVEEKLRYRPVHCLVLVFDFPPHPEAVSHPTQPVPSQPAVLVWWQL